MKKMKLKALSILGAAGILFGAITSPLMAFSFGVGVTGGATYFEVSGTETLKSSGATETATQDGAGGMPSVYAQIIIGESTFGEGNGFALGVDWKAGTAKVKGQSALVVDKRADEATHSGLTQYAEAEVQNYYTIFLETPGVTPLGLFLKGGWSEMDIITKEELGTGGTWPDATADGWTIGGGFKKTSEGGLQIKTELIYTDFDTVTVESTSDVASKIVATPELWTVSFGVGYNF